MEAAARAENVVIAHALGRGYLDRTQLEEARAALARQHPGGRPTGALLKLLRSDYLDTACEQDLLRVYRRALEGDDALDSTIQVEVPDVTDDASGDPEGTGPKTEPLPAAELDRGPKTEPLPAAPAGNQALSPDSDELRVTQDYDDPPDLGSALIRGPRGTPPTPAPAPPDSDLGPDLGSAHFSPTASWRRSKGSGRGPLGPGLHASDTWDEQDAVSVGPYQILGELARGGMGIVYRARHVDIPREVAIKMLLAGSSAKPAQLERFNTEARAAARLRHPNLVAIHDVGIQDGHPYLVMDFVAGENLYERLKRDGPLPVDQAARVALLLAEALDYAHGESVLHRDVTPLNVLLTASGEPLLTDFGLAKELDAVGTGVTQSGQFVGTPAYTAPEQAAGRVDLVDRRSDVYGLGATLYHCLTGEPPFDAESPLETLAQITSGQPTEIRTLRPEVPADLETICFTCLEKSRERRYPTMRALADDLRRYLDATPIRGGRRRPLAGVEVWARDHPWVLLVGALAALIVAGVGLRQARRAAARADDAEQALSLARDEAQAARGEARARQDELEAARSALEESRAELRVAKADQTSREEVAQARLDVGFTALEAGRLREAALAFARAHAGSRDPQLRRAARTGARSAVAQTGLRGRLVGSQRGVVLAVRYLPTGERLITAGDRSGAVTEWDLSRLQPAQTYRGHQGAVGALAVSPTGQFLLTGSDDKTLRLWDRETGATVRLLKGLRHGILETAFAKGRSAAVLVSGKTVSMFELSNGQRLSETPEQPSKLIGADVSRNQRLAVTVCGDERARVYDLSSGKEIQTIVHNQPIVAARFRADGREVLTIDAAGSLGAWSTIGGKPLARSRPSPAGGRPTTLRLSPDERVVAVGSRLGWVRLIGFPSLRELARFETQGRFVVDMAFSPDGRTLAVTSGNAVELRSLTPLLPADRGLGGQPGIRYVPGGALAWYTAQGAVLFDPDTKRRQRFPSRGELIAFATSRDGQRLATAGKLGIAVYDRATEQLIDTVEGVLAFRLAFNRDGRLLAIAGHDRTRGPTLRLRDLNAHRDVQRIPSAHELLITALTFTRDDRLLLSGDMRGVTRVWRLRDDSLTPLRRLQRQDTPAQTLRTRAAVGHIAVDAPGHVAFVAHHDGRVTSWDLRDGRLLRSIPAHTERITRLAVGPSTLVTGSYDHTVKIWELPSGRLLRTLNHGSPVISCDLGPDGETVVTGGKDRLVLFWDISRPSLPGFSADPEAAVRRALGLPATKETE